ncbi:MAG: ATP-binding cassette domain-containing protein [Planctomycetes bacterium]|nr:ATP-binding cassette domain-containing protein [Planctomycetota bacterium]
MSGTSHNAIHISQLGKKYKLGEQNDIFTITEYLGRSFKKFLGHQVKENVNNDFWALKDINYTLEKGKVLGVIGKNGSGKSTLLKVLSRITPPTEGEFSFNGTVSSLLEVGTGFKPELTGYDNIFLSGTILGMKRKDIQACMEQIIDFSEIGQFINTPVKRYSSGMYVRLAFAVAAHLDPDILLIDEVLAVGDLKFQRKCLERMGSVASEGRTVVFVSHNMQAISQLCSEALLLDKGQMLQSGDVNSVVEKYQDLNLSSLQAQGVYAFESDENEDASIQTISLGQSGKEKSNFDILEDIPIRVEVECQSELDDMLLEMGVYTLDGMCVLYSRELDWHNYKENNLIDQIPTKKGHYVFIGKIPAPLLNSGFYELQFRLTSPPQRLYNSRRGIQIHITDYHGSYSSCIVKTTSHGMITQPLKWDRIT